MNISVLSIPEYESNRIFLGPEELTEMATIFLGEPDSAILNKEAVGQIFR